jgi:hypothetical protein
MKWTYKTYCLQQIQKSMVGVSWSILMYYPVFGAKQISRNALKPNAFRSQTRLIGRCFCMLPFCWRQTIYWLGLVCGTAVFLTLSISQYSKGQNVSVTGFISVLKWGGGTHLLCCVRLKELMLITGDIHHRQNPLESTRNLCYLKTLQ